MAITRIPPISEPPHIGVDSKEQFVRKAEQVWDDLHVAVSFMNQSFEEIESFVGGVYIDTTTLTEKATIADNDISVLNDSADSNIAKKWKFSNLYNFIKNKISIDGNSATATKLATPRKINGVNFDGSTDITIKDNTKVDILRKQTTLNNDFKNILTVWGNIGNSYRLILHSTRSDNVFCGIFDITGTHHQKVDMIMSSSSGFSSIEFRAYCDSWGNHTLQARAIGGIIEENAACEITIIPYYVTLVDFEGFSNFSYLAFTKSFS